MCEKVLVPHISRSFTLHYMDIRDIALHIYYSLFNVSLSIDRFAIKYRVGDVYGLISTILLFYRLDHIKDAHEIHEIHKISTFML